VRVKVKIDLKVDATEVPSGARWVIGFEERQKGANFIVGEEL